MQKSTQKLLSDIIDLKMLPRFLKRCYRKLIFFRNWLVIKLLIYNFKKISRIYYYKMRLFYLKMWLLSQSATVLKILQTNLRRIYFGTFDFIKMRLITPENLRKIYFKTVYPIKKNFESIKKSRRSVFGSGDKTSVIATAVVEILTVVNSFIETSSDVPQLSGDFFFLIWEIDPVSLELFFVAIICAPLYYSEDSLVDPNDPFIELSECRQKYYIKFEKLLVFHFRNTPKAGVLLFYNNKKSQNIRNNAAIYRTCLQFNK